MPNLKPAADNPLIPLALCGLLYAIVHLTRLDPWVTAHFYDPWSNGFPARDGWLYKTVFHDWARWITFSVAAFAIGGLIITSIGFRNHWSLRAFAFTVVSMVITTTAISIIKHESVTHCPYDLSIYGGKFLEGGHLLIGNGDPTDAGRCWPSGHASAGFSLLALYFVARWRNSSWTRPALFFAVFLGLFFPIPRQYAARISSPMGCGPGYLSGWATPCWRD